MRRTTKRMKSGGGWPAIGYSLRIARRAGGLWKMLRAVRSKNTCKTCALGMGGQLGGMVNEAGHWPEICKKSLQAMAADMQVGIPDSFWSTYSIPQLRRFTPYDLEHCGRLTTPVVWRAGQQYYTPVDWSTALTEIGQRLRRTVPDESFWYFSGRASNEAAFLLQLMARVYGTNNVNNCSYFCHQASGVGLSASLGTGTATVALEDLHHADMVFVIGGNPPSNHPRLMTILSRLRRRGGEVIVINPVVETGLVNFRVPSRPLSLLFGSPIASLYIQPHIGGDLALLTGIAKRIVELGAADQEFLRHTCVGVDEYWDHLQLISWSEIVEKSGVAFDQIDDAARRYAVAKNVVFSWTMGITHHAHGVANVQAIANLALLRGMVARPHAGLLPIRGHSNVQGVGSMGATPQLRPAVLQRLASQYQLKLPTTPGLDTLACVDAARDGRVKLGFCLGGNLFGSCPDAAYAAESLGRLETIVYLNTTLNTGHAHGLAQTTFVLPVLPRDEEPEPTTQESMFNFVRMSDGGPRRHAGPRSEIEVICELADAVLDPTPTVDWRSLRNTSAVRHMIADTVPGFGPLADIDRTKREFHIDGRLLHQPRFPTPDGLARLAVAQLPPLAEADGMLRLMTVRSEGQFNTVVYEQQDIYRGQDRRDVILMHPDDLAARQLSDGQPVAVTSATGRLEPVLARSFSSIKPGNALMYYPEANVLVSREIDLRSRTPAFKCTLVAVSGTRVKGAG